jgi:signal transduction histidine kinase
VFNNLRTKLTVSYLVLILAVMVLTSFFLLNILEHYYLSHQAELPVNKILGDIRSFLAIATVLAMVVAGFLGSVFAHRMTVSITSLTKAIEQIAKGDLSQRVRVRSRDEIGQLADQFNIMASRLQEMTRQLREFVANSSHELRTPLTSLNILVKSLREYPLEKEEREEFLADIDLELERLTKLVENLLDLTRLDRLAAEDTMHSADIVPIIAGTLEMLRKRAELKGLFFSYTLPERSAPVFAVPHQLKQMVFNLVDNAIKYSLPGGAVTVSLRQEQDELLLTVADTGSGVPPEYREKIFERFYRVDKARSREQGGTGLGLAIVKEIVARHGGKVWAEDTPGGGATFMVSLPLALVPAQVETL